MIYNAEKFINMGGIVAIIQQIPAQFLSDTVTMPAFCVSGMGYRKIMRWTVGGDPMPEGITPEDVAGHYAARAAARFGEGVSVMVKTLEPADVWQAIKDARNANGARVFPMGNPFRIRLYAVKTESDAYALIVDGDTAAAMIPARLDDTAATERAAAVAREKARSEATDKAAGLYLDCVSKAIKDPAVMGCLLDAMNDQPIEAARRAFIARPYVLDAAKSIGGMV